jgi:TolA-binding protein
MDKFYKAQSFFTGEDYANAEKTFADLFSLDTQIVNPDMINNAKLMYFNSLFKLKKFNECSQEITEFLKSTKDSGLIKKSLFILADIYKGLGNADGEKSILQKIVLMTPVDDMTRKAKERMEAVK